MNALVPLSLMRPCVTRVSWSDETIEAAKRMSAEGKSAGAIAKAMRAEHPGVTRNAVIGKLHRMGLAGGGHRANRDGGQSAPPAPRLKRKAPALRLTVPSARVGRGIRARSEKRARLIERDVPSPEFIGITVADLSETSCRWPHGDPSDLDTFRYCGAQAEAERPYCPHHCGPAYVGTAAAYAKSTERNTWLMKA